MAYMADGLCVEIARPGHRQNVFVESQTAIQHDTEHFDLVGHRYTSGHTLQSSIPLIHILHHAVVRFMTIKT